MGFFETWVSASCSQFALVGVILAIASLIEVVFANVPNCKKTLNLRFCLSVLALAVFGVLGMLFCNKPQVGVNTIPAFITMVLAVVYGIYLFAISLIKIIKAEAEKSAGTYQTFMVAGSATALVYLLFVGLRQSDLIIHAEELASGAIKFITEVKNLPSNNLFLGILLVGLIVATVGALFVYLIKLYKEDKMKFLIVLSILFVIFIMAVPVYQAVIYNPGNATIEEEIGGVKTYIYPELVSIPMFALAFGTMAGLSVNPVLIAVPIIILVAIIANYFAVATNKGKGVINYATISLVTIASIIVIVAVSLKSEITVHTGSYFAGFNTSPIIELGIGAEVHEKVALVSQYADKYYYHATDIQRMNLVAPFFGIGTFAAVLAYAAIIVCATYVLVVVIKKAVEARKAYLLVNPKVIKQRARFNEEESPFFAKLGQIGWIIGAALAAIALALLFVVFKGRIDVTETQGANFTFMQVMLGYATTTQYGVLLRPNILVLVGAVFAVLALIFTIIGKFVDGEKPVLTVLSTLLFIAAGFIFIFAMGGLTNYTNELYILTANTSMFLIAGILFIIAGLIVSHKYSFKGLRFLVWFLVNNVGVVVCILCFIGLFLYWTGRIV